MTISVVFDPPLPADSPAVFNSKAFTLVGNLNTFSTQANATAADINADVTDPGVVAIGADLIGANTIGDVAANLANVVTVAGISANVTTVAGISANVTTVANNTANINAAVSDLPSLAAKVSKTGDTMTGPLEVPAGASGAQVPQAQEALLKAGNLSGLGNAATARTNLGLGTAATRAALGSTGALYSRDGILGSLAESAGVPTGALINNISNANGQSVLFADGTVIARGAPTGSAAGSVVWSFPVAFVAAPSVVFQFTGSVAGMVVLVSVNTTGAEFSTYNDAGARIAASTRAIAFGRWF